MSDALINDNGKLRKAEDIELAEAVIKAKEKGPWEVIDLLVSAWVKRAPEESQALKVSIDDQREMLDDPKFGQTKGGKKFERRFTIIFPSMLQVMIRTQYKAQELEFDNEFFKEFANRYPGFKVAEEV